MNDKQRRFAEYYAASGNAAQAARKAGYSERTARSIGQRLLTFADIAEYIRQIQARMESERVADIAEVKELWTTVLRDSGCKTSDRLKAGELLVKTAGELGRVAPRQQSATADPEDGEDKPRTVIQLPYNGGNEIINARQLEDGSVVPMLGAEDNDLLIYLPYAYGEEE